ncbi:MAG: non-canonical purine NTP pyrophosphatase [Marmoricola sp.]
MAEAPRVFLASRNPKKIEEMRRILDGAFRESGGQGVEVLGLDDVAAYDEPVENQPTLEGNALLKARAGVRATGLPSVADDSGLFVDALNGMPGVLSARWSGTAKDDLGNNRLLLEQLADVPDERRRAAFRAVVALVVPRADGGVDERVVHGEMTGRVIREMRGDGGFGYDVLFVADDQDGELTTAEMTAEEKDLISHRGKSVRAIAPVVAELLSS